MTEHELVVLYFSIGGIIGLISWIYFAYDLWCDDDAPDPPSLGTIVVPGLLSTVVVALWPVAVFFGAAWLVARLIHALRF